MVHNRRWRGSHLERRRPRTRAARRRCAEPPRDATRRDAAGRHQEAEREKNKEKMLKFTVAGLHQLLELFDLPRSVEGMDTKKVRARRAPCLDEFGGRQTRARVQTGY